MSLINNLGEHIQVQKTDLFHKVAHDLYMAMAHVKMPRQYRDQITLAMNSYVEVFYGKP